MKRYLVFAVLCLFSAGCEIRFAPPKCPVDQGKPCDGPNCPCPQKPERRRVGSDADAPTAFTNHGEPRTGILRCARCGGSMVGTQVHTEWLSTECPASVLCEGCYRSSSPAERNQHFAKWIDTQPAHHQDELRRALKKLQE